MTRNLCPQAHDPDSVGMLVHDVVSCNGVPICCLVKTSDLLGLFYLPNLPKP